MKPQKIFITFVFITFCVKSFGQNVSSQNSNASSIYTVFDTFFEDEIKKQGVKGNWIFKLNEISGFHKFDFNEDGYQDIFIEFSAVQEVGEGRALYFTVLFKNYSNEEYILVNFLKSPEMRFAHFEENLFYFNSSVNETDKMVYELVNSKFIKL